ncbi:cerebellin-1-like [Saccostrea echinata]|uniref:cerebellin-1-like n=1 Tax=Saccostrea echinata TaxID=191078 RepID=UPI002A800ACB|nr:cerebellin-1-like [Saccostrea echinata]
MFEIFYRWCLCLFFVVILIFMCTAQVESQMIYNSNEKWYEHERRLTDLEDRMKRLQLEKQQNKHLVGFSVTAKDDIDEKITRSGQIIILKNVLLNIGDGYNSTTGTFTAPVDGKYAFFISVEVQRGDVLHVLLTVNDKYVLEAIAGVRHAPDTVTRYYTGANMAIISLQKNDVVCLKSQQMYIYSNAIRIRYSGNSFSGFLIPFQ